MFHRRAHGERVRGTLRRGHDLTLPEADARFLLPSPVRTAAVLGGLHAWRAALAQTGVEVHDGGPVDLAVAPSSHVGEALAVDADSLLLTGRPALRRLRAAGLRPQPLAPLAGRLVPLDRAEPRRYALLRAAAPDRPWKVVRNRVAAAALGSGVVPPSGRLLTVARRREDPPFPVAAAGRLGVPPDVAWLLVPGHGDELARPVLLLFRRGERDPAWVLKLARVRGYAEPFDRDEHGLRVAEAAGGSAAAGAPRLLGRFQTDGHHASLETAAPGRPLLAILESSASTREKQRAIDRVAGWVIRVGRDTAGPPEALGRERARLADDVLPRSRNLPVPPDLVARVPPIPAVVQHNDLGSWNVLLEGERLTAIDWESARAAGLPLWDLLYFLADALSHLDGATGLDAQDRHFQSLFAGELPSSAILFRWLHAGVDSLGLPPECVGPVATLCWLHHALSRDAREESIARHGGGEAPIYAVWRRADLWFRHAALGPEWDRWRTGA